MDAEYRCGLEVASRRGRIMVPRMVFLAAALAAAGLTLCLGGCDLGEPAPGRMAASPPQQRESALASLVGQPIGDPDAKVKVVAFLPLSVGCKDHLAWYLLSVAREFPSKVSLVVLDMTSEQGYQAMKEHGLKCATILINGESAFDLGPYGKVLLEGRDLGDIQDVRQALAAGENAAEAAALLASYGKLDYVHLNDNYRSWDDDMMVGAVHLVEYLELAYWLRRLNYKDWLTLDIFPYREKKVPAAIQCREWMAAFFRAVDRVGMDAIAGVIKRADATEAAELVRRAVSI